MKSKNYHLLQYLNPRNHTYIWICTYCIWYSATFVLITNFWIAVDLTRSSFSKVKVTINSSPSTTYSFGITNLLSKKQIKKEIYKIYLLNSRASVNNIKIAFNYSIMIVPHIFWKKKYIKKIVNFEKKNNFYSNWIINKFSILHIFLIQKSKQM